MIWMPDKRLWRPRLVRPQEHRNLVGAARGAVMGAAGRTATSPISLVNFTTLDVGTATSPWDINVTFDGTENAIYVCPSFEANVDISSVVVRNAGDTGDDVTLLPLRPRQPELVELSNVQFWQDFSFTPVSAGVHIVRTTFTANADGSVAVWTYRNATRAATTGDFGSANSNSVNSLSVNLTIVDGVENGGYIMAGANVNILEGMTASGVVTERFEDQSHGGGSTTWFADARGSLSTGVNASGLGWTTNARSALQVVLAA